MLKTHGRFPCIPFRGRPDFRWPGRTRRTFTGPVFVPRWWGRYDPSWGRHKARTYPSPGNHDYHTADAAGYFDYFGSMAGEPGKGYYSYDLGAWHIIALNSNIPVGTGSPQEQWLRADLAAHSAACTLAYWHYPRFSSGTAHGSVTSMQPLWQALYDFSADVVLAGHEHNYERFAPQDPQGVVIPHAGFASL